MDMMTYFTDEVVDCYQLGPSKACAIFRDVILCTMSYEDAWDEMNMIMGKLSRFRDKVIKESEKEPIIDWEKATYKGVEIATLHSEKKEHALKETKSAVNERNRQIFWESNYVKAKLKLESDILQFTRLFLIQAPERTAELLELELNKERREEILIFLKRNVDYDI